MEIDFNNPTQITRAIAVLHQAGRIVIATLPNMDFWILPGGLIEKGEDPLQAIRRECA